MRSLLIIAMGIILLALLLWRYTGAKRRSAMWIFSLVWLGVCGWNLNLGLSHGYALGEELLVHAFVYGIPVGLGWWRVKG
ncbi:MULTISPECIES: hypothetical protein [Halomonas]|jgi:hypothetical protein|uniref:Uncharacterized protein n=1 Tax=Halomonas binhaiensis TaxID=2562282 RepID=A0A5C1NKR2_9GAMM|nr:MULTISPECIES: hypothetical protein [Halomonas]QEM83271.1 hypothetical protein E4T21_18230 [Halomonas binhaiensis]